MSSEDDEKRLSALQNELSGYFVDTSRIHQHFQEVNASPEVFRWKYKMDEVNLTS